MKNEKTVRNKPFILKYECVLSHSVVSDSLQLHGLYVALQLPSSMGFSRPEYWSGLPFPTSEDLPYPGIEPASLALVGRFFTTKATISIPKGNQP